MADDKSPNPSSLVCGHASSKVVIEPLEGISKKGEAHLGALFLRPWHLAVAASSGLSGLQQRGIVRLVDLVRREVGGVDVGGQPGLEWCPDSAQTVELDAPEERMALDLVRPSATETVLRVANQTIHT